jgi:hypothetical protein
VKTEGSSSNITAASNDAIQISLIGRPFERTLLSPNAKAFDWNHYASRPFTTLAGVVPVSF